MTPAVAYTLAIAASIVAGWLIPALAMRGLAPSLETSPLVTTNYRGRTVFLGLGTVWAVWSVSLLAMGTVLDGILSLGESEYGSVEMLVLDGPPTMALYVVPMILTLSAVLFGLVDDVFGSHGDKGFGGHLRALASGRLTTGGLKLLGIGAVCAVYGWHAASRSAEAAGATSTGVLIGWWITATLVIALSANLLNLTDLRPGRALKSYILLVVPVGTLFALDAVDQYRTFAAEAGGALNGTAVALTLVCMYIVLLGPVLAVWQFDLGERGMLGDAGSNAMGAIVGYLLAGSLSLPWLAFAAVVLLGLNAISERVSFSAIIEATPPLRCIDGIGRLKMTDASGSAGEGGPT